MPWLILPFTLDSTLVNFFKNLKINQHELKRKLKNINTTVELSWRMKVTENKYQTFFMKIEPARSKIR